MLAVLVRVCSAGNDNADFQVKRALAPHFRLSKENLSYYISFSKIKCLFTTEGM